MAEVEKGIKLTKTIVDKLEHTAGKTQTFYRDNDLKGLALRITSGDVKSFIVETRINGKVKRMTLGKYDIPIMVRQIVKRLPIMLCTSIRTAMAIQSSQLTQSNTYRIPEHSIEWIENKRSSKHIN